MKPPHESPRTHQERIYKPLSDPIAVHSRALIKALEQKIKAEFGYIIQIGMEKEFVADITTSKTSGYPNKPEMMSRTNTNLMHHQIVSQSKHPSARLPVTNFNIEGGTNQYEFKTEPSPPSQAVIRMDTQCTRLESYRNILGYDNMPHIKNVDFTPFSSTEFSGLHVNFSLWKKADSLHPSKNITFDIEDTKKRSILVALHQYVGNDTLLICPSDDAFQRRGFLSSQFYYDRDSTNEILATKINFVSYRKPRLLGTFEEQKTDRIEFRSPSSDARHDLSVLMTMSATYEGLKSTSEFVNKPIPKIAPKSKDEAIERFEESSALMPDLKKMAGDDAELQKHVSALQNEILKAAKIDKLTQPILSERAR